MSKSAQPSANAGSSTLLTGAAVLGAAGIFSKAAGAVYRIPLANLLGTEGSGYYGMAYPVFSALAAVATLGIPTGISQLVASCAGAGRDQSAARLFHVSMRFLLLLGSALSIAFFLLSGYLADVVRTPDAAYSFRAVSPAFLFVALLAGIRGYLQGYQIMEPTAVSQIVEQIGKLVIALGAAALVLKTTQNAAYAAGAALFGITCAEGTALVSIMISFARSPLRRIHLTHAVNRSERREDLRALVSMTVPVTIGACVMPVILSLDSLEVSPALQLSGMSRKEAASQVGILTMNVAPFVNMPTALSAALAMSVVPSLAGSDRTSPDTTADRQMSLALKVALIIALPCASGLALFAQPIMRLLFRSLSACDLAAAAQLLQIMSISVFCLVMLQTVTGILQGVHHQVLPVAALAAAAAIKAVLTPVLVRRVGITGAAWASCVCFAAALVLDVYFMHRRTQARADRTTAVLMPFCATGIMCAAAAAVYAALAAVSQTAAVVTAVLFGAVLYVLLLCRMGSVTYEELSLIPGGKKLARFAEKLGIWKHIA